MEKSAGEKMVRVGGREQRGGRVQGNGGET